MTTENDELIKRLRTTPPNVLKEREAANALQALEAELDRAKYSKQLFETAANGFKTERDALQAKLTALEKQEPVVWRREWEGDVSDLDSWLYIEDEADKDELPWQSLYPAAGAAQPASAAVPVATVVKRINPKTGESSIQPELHAGVVLSPGAVLYTPPVSATMSKLLREMVEMMDSGDVRGAGSPWHLDATAAIAAHDIKGQP